MIVAWSKESLGVRSGTVQIDIAGTFLRAPQLTAFIESCSRDITCKVNLDASKSTMAQGRLIHQSGEPLTVVKSHEAVQVELAQEGRHAVLLEPSLQKNN